MPLAEPLKAPRMVKARALLLSCAFSLSGFLLRPGQGKLLGMGWDAARAGKWVIFCLLCHPMTHLGNHFLHPFFSLCPLQKQIRSVERYIRKLEFHISKVRGYTCACKGSIHMENTLIIIHLKGRMLGTC